ncbi:MAG: glycosyltransferase family 9 protein [Candidatus Pacebacteria bacterium]|nr:glycosyltransferase family 9 protein [Candidatus Paceibacterota bacterium]
MNRENTEASIESKKGFRRIKNKVASSQAVRFLFKNMMSLVGTLFLTFIGAKINKDGYEKRILVVFGGGIGDVIKRSIICGYFKEYLKGYDLYYLMPYPLDLPYAKESIFFDYTRVKMNPRYYADTVNRLRRIGFSKVIVAFPFWDGLLSFLGGDVVPEQLFCHKEAPPHPFYGVVSEISYLLKYPSLRKRMRFIRVVSGWDKAWTSERLPSDVLKHAYFISHVIAAIKGGPALDKNGLLPLADPHTEVVIDGDMERDFMEELRKEYGLDAGSYCVIGLGSSTIQRNWPVEKFVEVAKFLGARGIKIVISEHMKDKDLAERFMAGYPDALDLTGKTDIRHAMILIKHARLLVANDTSFTHAAVALHVPNVCVIGNKGLGADSLYGYESINKWAFEDPGSEVPVAAVKPETVIETCREILDRKHDGAKEAEKFQFEYGSGL